MENKKLMVLAHGRHGKGTFGKIADDLFGLKAGSSSAVANELFMYEQLKDKYGYTSPEECYADRHNHRDEWFQGILDFNTPDLTALAEALLARYPIYDGNRSRLEFNAIKAKQLFDVCIWIDGSERHPRESSSSFELTEDDADVSLDNNATPLSFFPKAVNLLDQLGYPTRPGIHLDGPLLESGDLAELAAQMHRLSPIKHTLIAEHVAYDSTPVVATTEDQYGQQYFLYWLSDAPDAPTRDWAMLPLTNEDRAQIENGAFDVTAALRERQVLVLTAPLSEHAQLPNFNHDLGVVTAKKLSDDSIPNKPFYPKATTEPEVTPPSPRR